MSDIKASLKTLLSGATLSCDEMENIMGLIMNGAIKDTEMASLFTMLSYRGETIDEITGAAKAVRNKAAHINAPDDAVDCCGTGGDGANTYNISTAVAFVAGACGVPVAKHGNRSASSKSGAADALEAAGINLNVPKEKLEKALQTLKFCFLMAPHHHEALKHAKQVRSDLGFRTIGNLIGPLANPAGTQLQLIGVFDEKWLMPMVSALLKLGTKRAWIVHGSDGLDEITLSGTTHIAALQNGEISSRTVTAADFGLNEIDISDIKGGDAGENARALLGLLNDEAAFKAYKSIVLANAAAVLHIHNPKLDLIQATSLAKESIESGKALKLFEDYKSFVAA